MGRCRVGEVRTSTTSPMPDHKGFKLYSNCQRSTHSISKSIFRNLALKELKQTEAICTTPVMKVVKTTQRHYFVKWTAVTRSTIAGYHQISIHANLEIHSHSQPKYICVHCTKLAFCTTRHLTYYAKNHWSISLHTSKL